jgi:hypothetical protein
VADLKVAWVFHTGDIFDGSERLNAEAGDVLCHNLISLRKPDLTQFLG